jgi:hypothetical protein
MIFPPHDNVSYHGVEKSMRVNMKQSCRRVSPILFSLLIPTASLARFIPVLALVLVITACSDIQKMDIEAVLDARNSAVSEGNINAYSRLLLPSYYGEGQNKFDVINKMLELFKQFEAMEMKTFGRTIRILDDNHAQCEQTYFLRLKADNKWRKISQIEQILLTRTEAGWLISGGL